MTKTDVRIRANRIIFGRANWHKWSLMNYELERCSIMSDKTKTVVDESLPAVLEDIARTDVTVDVAELELQSTRVVSWLDSDPEQLRSALVRRSENRRSVIEWIWENLVENVDYGRIHVVKDCPDKRGGCTVPHARPKIIRFARIRTSVFVIETEVKTGRTFKDTHFRSRMRKR
jgi:hypothetical protein